MVIYIAEEWRRDTIIQVYEYILILTSKNIIRVKAAYISLSSCLRKNIVNGSKDEHPPKMRKTGAIRIDMYAVYTVVFSSGLNVNILRHIR